MKNFMVKMQFINTLQSSEQILLSGIFEQLSSFEEKYSKDCASFRIKEIDDFFKSNPITPDFMFDAICDLLNRYSSYYAEYNGRDVDNELYYSKYKKLKEEKQYGTKNNYKYVLNYKELITPRELDTALENINSIFDRMLLLAVYEGLYVLDDIKDLIYIDAKSCNIYTGTVSLRSGLTIEVSSRLMDLLIQCSKEDEYFANSQEHEIIRSTKMSGDRSFKNLAISEDMSDMQIRRKIKSVLDRIRKTVGNEKLTIFALRISGYINRLIDIGYKSDFENPKLLKIPEVRIIAEQYKLCYAKPGDYKRAIINFLIDTE